MPTYQLLLCAERVKADRKILILRSGSFPAALSPGQVVETPGGVFHFHFADYLFIGLIISVVSFNLQGGNCTYHIIPALLPLVDQQLVSLRRDKFLMLMRFGEKYRTDVGVQTPHCEDNVTDIVRVIPEKGPSLYVLDCLRYKVGYDIQLSEFLVLQDLGVRNILPVDWFAIEMLVRGLEKVELFPSFLSAKLKLNHRIITCQ